ncbi:MAG TPA: GTPase Era [Polyangiaceae bacterium]|jgi:GTP-binding protein Era|nr:GTPase Era [Polyangiaceae bacterium]
MTDSPATPAPTRSGRVALLGRPNVGKSTLLNALLGEPIAIISSHPQTTRDVVRGVLTRGDTQYVFLDTPGVHSAKNRLGTMMNEAARGQAREADVVVLLVEPEWGPDQNAGDLALAKELDGVPVVLVINKIDRLKDKTKLLPILAAFSEKHAFAATVPMSAKRADGTERLLKELRELLPEQPFLYEPDTLSDQPVRFFVAEFVREQILQHTRQEVPHGVAVVVERFDESSDVPHIELAIHVAREGHKGILVGAKGNMMKRIGTAARMRVEKMLGRKVHLKLWVRTSPDWMNDPAKLRDLGYGPESTR